MGKAFRKPVPQPPRWYWVDNDNCYCCKNRNNCGNCRSLKKFHAQELEKRKREENKKLRMSVLEY